MQKGKDSCTTTAIHCLPLLEAPRESVANTVSGTPFPTPASRWLPLLEAPRRRASVTRNASLPTKGTISPSNQQPGREELTSSHAVQHQDMLTPPTTPDKANSTQKRLTSLSIDSTSLVKRPSEALAKTLSVAIDLGVDPEEIVSDVHERGLDAGSFSSVPETARLYQRRYKLHEEIGYGAWSNVYSASELTTDPVVLGAGQMPLTPPRSPEPSKRSSAARILAVKRAARKDGIPVLQKEARILTYLHSQASSAKHLVPFHGLEASQKYCSIIMSCASHTLHTYVKEAAFSPRGKISMFDPIVGAEEWSNLALHLISGLAFLHKYGCIHGDVKPSNILMLRETGDTGEEALQPLFCDFSSSQVIAGDTGFEDLERITACTTEYTAPELLNAFKPGNGTRAIATFKCDIFALGVTLLFAATGERPYAGASTPAQMTAMAEQGEPLEFARTGNEALRVREGKVVDNIVSASVADAEKRIEVDKWKNLSKGLVSRWRKDDWEEGWP